MKLCENLSEAMKRLGFFPTIIINVIVNKFDPDVLLSDFVRAHLVISNLCIHRYQCFFEL